MLSEEVYVVAFFYFCCIAANAGQKWSMLASALRILVIDENRIRAAIIEAGLREAGHAEVTLVDDV